MKQNLLNFPLTSNVLYQICSFDNWFADWFISSCFRCHFFPRTTTELLTWLACPTASFPPLFGHTYYLPLPPTILIDMRRPTCANWLSGILVQKHKTSVLSHTYSLKCRMPVYFLYKNTQIVSYPLIFKQIPSRINIITRIYFSIKYLHVKRRQDNISQNMFICQYVSYFNPKRLLPMYALKFLNIFAKHSRHPHKICMLMLGLERKVTQFIQLTSPGIRTWKSVSCSNFLTSAAPFYTEHRSSTLFTFQMQSTRKILRNLHYC